MFGNLFPFMFVADMLPYRGSITSNKQDYMLYPSEKRRYEKTTKADERRKCLETR